jgi:hypothetical protein
VIRRTDQVKLPGYYPIPRKTRRLARLVANRYKRDSWDRTQDLAWEAAILDSDRFILWARFSW